MVINANKSFEKTRKLVVFPSSAASAAKPTSVEQKKSCSAVKSKKSPAKRVVTGEKHQNMQKILSCCRKSNEKTATAMKAEEPRKSSCIESKISIDSKEDIRNRRNSNKKSKAPKPKTAKSAALPKAKKQPLPRKREIKNYSKVHYLRLLKANNNFERLISIFKANFEPYISVASVEA